MQITTLGALAVDGRPVRGDRLAALLRELVDAQGGAMSTASLVEAVWREAPPEDAAGALQALVSRLRRLGLPVAAAPGGYRLPAELVTVDAREAEALAERAGAALHAGDLTGAGAAADAARALFPPVPELSDVRVARLLAEVAAVRAEAALASGQWRAGTGRIDDADLRRLAAGAPPDEPSAALLVRVLAAQGRDSEALEVVQRLRAELADRYGSDLSPVVAAVHVALLRGELAGPGAASREPAPSSTPAVTPPPAVAPSRASTAAPFPAPAAARDRGPVRGAGRAGAASGLPPAWRRPSTPLVGRVDDLAAVTAALAAAPVVTIVGPGGAGKTRLATEVARRSAAAHVVELAGLRSPDEVAPAVLAVIGRADPSELTQAARGVRVESRLRAAAAELHGVVVLDNCEHVLAAAAAVTAELLAAAPPEVAVLATSRAPLSLVGEVVHRLGALSDADALALLEARVRAGGVVPSWTTGPADPAAAPPVAASAVELCHRLDNLPLALELAAARLRHMPLEDVLSGLEDRFALLDDALRGLPERHASLWTMVDWSRELLAPEDRELLQRLAVLPGTFAAEAAASVAGRSDVRQGLATLVEQSLLVLTDGRYRMLETVREYGEVRLGDDRDAALAGLLAWARRLAVELFARFTGPGQIVAFGRCAIEQDNLVAALRWAIARDDEPAAVDVGVALLHLWTVRGLHEEAAGWAGVLVKKDDPVARRTSVIAHGRRAGRSLPDADRLGWMCLVAGINGGISGTNRIAVLAVRALRVVLAERSAEVSARVKALASMLPALATIDTEVQLKLADELVVNRDPYIQGYGLMLRASVRENAGLAGASTDDAEQAYLRFEAVGDHWGMGTAAQGIGQWFGWYGKEGADEWLRRSRHHLELIGAAGDARSVGLLLDFHLAIGGDVAALHRLERSAEASDLRDLDAAYARFGLAHLAIRQERYDDALAHADTLVRLVAQTVAPGPQVRIFFRVAAAIVHLRVAEVRAEPEADARAAALLRLARPEALSTTDIPVLGSWAVGGAALAAARGQTHVARLLWSGGLRYGANVAFLFQHGNGDRLTEILSLEDDREPVTATWNDLPMNRATARIRELMANLLGD